MEQVTHILVDTNSYSIIVFGNMGSQRTLRFHFSIFYDALEYCAARMRREHILYLS